VGQTSSQLERQSRGGRERERKKGIGRTEEESSKRVKGGRRKHTYRVEGKTMGTRDGRPQKVVEIIVPNGDREEKPRRSPPRHQGGTEHKSPVTDLGGDRCAQKPLAQSTCQIVLVDGGSARRGTGHQRKGKRKQPYHYLGKERTLRR